jgi:hypothetical protein
MFVVSMVYFTHLNLNVFIFTFLGAMLVCFVYINFMSVRIKEDQK